MPHSFHFYLFICKSMWLIEQITSYSQWWAIRNLKELQKNHAHKLSDSVKCNRELLLVRPHKRDQSNRVWINWAFDLFVSSNMHLFRSFHNNHIKHNGTKFQISDECFPNQILHPNKRSSTLLGNTQLIPKALFISFYSLPS